MLWLKTFCTLVEVGHFTQTANKLFMTQSGVSQHIKKLEQQLETQLLIKDGKSFSLNEAGNQLYQRGKELLRSSEELATLVKQDEKYQGQISISSPGSVGLKLYPYLLDIQQTHQQLIINHAFAPNQNIEKNLTERKIDLGLITEESNNNNLISTMIAIEPLVLITSHQVTSVDWPTLIELGFISHPDAAHHGRLLLSKNFKEFEHVEQFLHKGFSNQISLILEPVSKGLGFTVLPLYAVKAFHSPHLISVHTLQTAANEKLYLCRNRHATFTNRMKVVSSLIEQYLG